MNTPIGKLLLLFMIYLCVKQNEILGLVAAAIMMFALIKPIETFSPKSGKPSLLPIDETIRPKNSNSISVTRNSVAPPGEEISGSIAGPVANNTVGSYSQINL